MTKFKKLAAMTALMLSLAGLALFGGCSGTAVENLGIYHYNRSEYRVIEQGKLMNSYSDSMTIYSDNTFAVSCVYDSYYSSDGEAYNPVYYSAYNMYGTYEVVSEDAELGEKTIQITDVTMFQVDTLSGSILKEEFSEELSTAVSETLIGKELLLTSDYKISEQLIDFRIYGVLTPEE